MDNLNRAKEILKQGHTCVLVKDQDVIISDKTGIAPMMGFIESGMHLEGYSVADKIVGKAVAMLFAISKVKEVFAEVLSKSAIKVLEDNGISYSYDTLTDKIINRKKTGICPMEECVENINDLDVAYKSLKEKLSSLSKSQIN